MGFHKRKLVKNPEQFHETETKLRQPEKLYGISAKFMAASRNCKKRNSDLERREIVTKELELLLTRNGICPQSVRKRDRS